MIAVMTLVSFLFVHQQRTDTIRAVALQRAPVVDGQIGAEEYGTPALRIATPGGDVPVWIARHDGFVYIATTIADSSFYWGDDFVISLDPHGRHEASVASGARQWYLRRTLDSSVVAIAPPDNSGRWSTTEPLALGARRGDVDWTVASASHASGWSLELRIDAAAFKAGADLPRIAFRTYNDAPRGWWSWPTPPQGVPAQRVERSPELWSAVLGSP